MSGSKNVVSLKNSGGNTKPSDIVFPQISSEATLEIFFNKVKDAIIERSHRRGQDQAKLAIIQIALDEVRLNKLFLDSKRESTDALGNKMVIDLSNQSNKLISNLETIYKFLVDQDKSTIDFTGLKQVIEFFINLIVDILVMNFKFDNADVEKFHNYLKMRGKEVDQYIMEVVRSQSETK